MTNSEVLTIVEASKILKLSTTRTRKLFRDASVINIVYGKQCVTKTDVFEMQKARWISGGRRGRFEPTLG